MTNKYFPTHLRAIKNECFLEYFLTGRFEWKRSQLSAAVLIWTMGMDALGSGGASKPPHWVKEKSIPPHL
jgi:hypothetical protein